MINYKVLVPILLLIGLLTVLFLYTFERKDVSSADWSVDYRLESKEPYGAWMFNEILKIAYGEDQVVPLKEDYFNKINSTAKRKGYLHMSSYIEFSRSQVDSLTSFVEAGNDAMLMTEDWSYTLDTLLSYITIDNEYEGGSTCLSIMNQSEDYVLNSYYLHFDSNQVAFYSSVNIDVDSILYDWHIVSSINREYPVTVNLSVGEGNLFLHTVPDIFTNMALEQEDMSRYALKLLPLLDIDTLYTDNGLFDNPNNEDAKSPLQFVMSQPPLKWAYYVMSGGLLLFVISRGTRKQRVIPTLEQNENTSIEYVNTLGELYRSQNQHYKLAKHLKLIFNQWVKKKYFLQTGEPNYTQRLSQKSRMPEEEIQRLINRLNASENNKRFDDTQLTNLYKDLEQFYKNCQ